MKDAARWLTTFLMLGVSASYIFAFLHNSALHPSSATWLIFALATSMVVASYRKAGQGDAKTGALLIADMAATGIIFLALVVHSGFRLHFRSFEYWYLIGALVIGLFWWKTRDHLMTNLLVQALIVIGTLPTWQKLVVDKLNSEPFLPWLICLTANIVGLITTFLPDEDRSASKSDILLSRVYACRSTVSIGITLLLMYHYS